MDQDARTNLLADINDVHAALHLLSVEVLRGASREELRTVVEIVEDEVHYLSF